jgi:hypothetical protein
MAMIAADFGISEKLQQTSSRLSMNMKLEDSVGYACIQRVTHTETLEMLNNRFDVLVE